MPSVLSSFRNFAKLTIRMVAKSIFYQGNWNVRNMQGTGFSWIVRPYLKDKLTEEDSKRLAEYFNTNPVFITLVAGMFIKEYEKSDAFMAKKIYSAAFAALGDSFFWHALRPFLFILTLLGVFYFSPWFILLYPLVYTLILLLFLFIGWYVSQSLGLYVIQFFNNMKFNQWADHLDNASLFLLGFFLVKLLKDDGVNDIKQLAILLILFAIGFVVYKFIRFPVFLWLVSALMIVILVLGGY